MDKYNVFEITKLYPNWYDKSSLLSFDDQKWIWENVPLPREDEEKLRNSIKKVIGISMENNNVSVSGNDNGIRKFGVNSELNWHKSELIFELKRCTSFTSPNEIASLMEEIFKPWSSKEGHWLWVAQTYTVRTINWVMAVTVKEYLRGGIRKNPPAYFTYILKFRKKRKELRSTNDTHKSKVVGDSSNYDKKE